MISFDFDNFRNNFIHKFCNLAVKLVLSNA